MGRHGKSAVFFKMFHNVFIAYLMFLRKWHMSVLRDSATMLLPRNPPQRRRPCLKAGSKSLNFLLIFISTLSDASVDVIVFDLSCELAPFVCISFGAPGSSNLG